MFYTLFVLVFGVYIGQEYQIPAVKLLVNSGLVYLNDHLNKEKPVETSWYDIIKLYTKKD